MDNTHISLQHEHIKGMLTLFNGVEFDNFPWGDRPAPGYPVLSLGWRSATGYPNLARRSMTIVPNVRYSCPWPSCFGLCPG